MMPTGQSFWIDESSIGTYSRLPTFSELVENLSMERNSDAQFPLGVAFFWAGAQISGSSEVGLRSLAALWILVGALVLWRVGVRLGLPYLPALLCCNAFVWYYGGEARPYSMQIAFGCGLVYALVLCTSVSDRGSVGGLATAFFWGALLWATCMLGIVPAVAVVSLVLFAYYARNRPPPKKSWVKIVPLLLVYLLIGIYYTWTLIQGKGAGSVGSWHVGFKNLIFAFYELLGFVGFGPGRHELRELGVSGGIGGPLTALAGSPGVVGMILLAVLYLWIGVRIGELLRRGSRIGRVGLTAGLVVGVITSVIFLLSLAVDFPFWGRHLSPLAGFVALVIAVGARPQANGGPVSRALPVIVCVVLLVSGLYVRFDPRHQRDDYREAVRVAQVALSSGKRVWWAASDQPTHYYGLDLCQPNGSTMSSCAEYTSIMDAHDLVRLAEPHVILLSKPDLHDRYGLVQAFIDHHEYVLTERFAAFEVFKPNAFSTDRVIDKQRPN
jgi:hypothetical protein